GSTSTSTRWNGSPSPPFAGCSPERSKPPPTSRPNSSASSTPVPTAGGPVPRSPNRGPSPPARAPSSTTNRRPTARTAAGTFSPQRVPLGLNSHAYSPRAIKKIVEAGAELKSFAAAARVLKNLAGLTISAQHVRRLTEEVGGELAARRDRAVEDYVHHRRAEPGEPVPAGAVVAVDGGR